MVNIFSEFDKPDVRNKIKSYMVQHYNTSPSVKTTQADSGPAECLAAGIPYWTNYIDTAVEMKGWAAFCIHNIRPDTHDTRSGHYIYQSQADQLFGHAQRLSDEGKLWIATLSEGMIYANEWVASSVQAYEDGGKLCEMVRANPYSVVLFDEIEKAHPDIYNLLLQILDEGELISSMGRKISFKNTIVILTSNIGAENAISSTRLGFGSLNEENKQSNIDKELKRVFTTEFLNRLDEIIAFEPLSFDDARKICSLMIDELTDRAKEKGIFLDIDSDTISSLTKIGYSKEYGARSIRRAITGLFENSLCDAILNGEISLDKRVCASFEQSQIKYKQMLI
jgi:hypothetical protein